jgi:hypothetical protein
MEKTALMNLKWDAVWNLRDDKLNRKGAKHAKKNLGAPGVLAVKQAITWKLI